MEQLKFEDVGCADVTSTLTDLVGTVYYTNVFVDVCTGLDSSIYTFQNVTRDFLINLVVSLGRAKEVKTIHIYE